MSELLKHRGYLWSVKCCGKERMYHGTMQNVRALVLYDAKDLDGLQSVFEEAVAHYINVCESEGCDPGGGMPVDRCAQAGDGGHCAPAAPDAWAGADMAGCTSRGP